MAELAELGVGLKMISGVNAKLASHGGERVGLSPERMLTKAELEDLNTAALPTRARDLDIFAELEPSQKERLVLALRCMPPMGRSMQASTSGSNPATRRGGPWLAPEARL